METEEIISKLKESLEKDHGDYGRTQYVIEKLEKDEQLPKSDYLYIERMVNLCKSIIEESEPVEIIENILSEDLIKCQHCDLQIELDEKSVRKNNFWFHDKCFEKIPILKQDTQQKTKSISTPKQPVKIIQTHF